MNMNKNARPMVASTLRRTIITILLPFATMTGLAQGASCMEKYKGKAVLIDIWATWCGPCRYGHKVMAPMKEQMKGQNIQFVYITSPSSPLKAWQEMIKDIDGDHYYLTKEQYDYILNKYESDGIPTYAIYNISGEQTYKNIGFPGTDVIRKEIETASK